MESPKTKARDPLDHALLIFKFIIDCLTFSSEVNGLRTTDYGLSSRFKALSSESFIFQVPFLFRTCSLLLLYFIIFAYHMP